MPLFELDHVLSLVLGHLGKDISQRRETLENTIEKKQIVPNQGLLASSNII